MRERSTRLPAAILVLLAAGSTAGCSTLGHGTAGGGAARATASPVADCGPSRTAAGVPVTVEVVRGSTPCATALAVERDYQRAIASGKVAGNGGGAPVSVDGWVCQGFNTPELLATGHASACRRAGAEVLAVLATPSPTPS